MKNRTTEFVRRNNKPIPIERVPDEHEESRDFQPSFWWFNRRYFLGDFVRVHNNPWFSDSGIPEFIHGIEADSWISSLFIELIGDEAVNVYEEEETE